jgi:hypothetical protein
VKASSVGGSSGKSPDAQSEHEHATLAVRFWKHKDLILHIIFQKQKVKLMHTFIGLGFPHNHISMLQHLLMENKCRTE